MRSTLLAITILIMLAVPSIYMTNIINTTPENNKAAINSTKDERIYTVKQLPSKLLENPVIIQKLKAQQTSDSWWDKNWEYRINVTITEPNITDRTNWPVDIYLTFNPPAFKYSIRVIWVTGSSFIEIPSQIWNATYYNTTHLSSATVTFLATIPKGATYQYQIYWSTDYTDPPAYPKRLSVTTTSTANGDLYTINSIKGWSAELPPIKGGKVMNITLPNGEKIGHTWTHFGVTRNTNLSYEGYWGSGTTNNVMYTDRYILESTDSLLSIYQGVIFVTYVVENVSLYDTALGGIVVAEVNYTYRFFDWGIIVGESVKWVLNDTNGVTYYTAGWVFDQDDGPLDSTFDKVYTPTQTYELPIAQTMLESGTFYNYWNHFKLYDSGLPIIQIFRIYVTAGNHYVILRSRGDDYYPGSYTNDEIYGRVAAPNGTWLPLTDGAGAFGLYDDGYAVYGDAAHDVNDVGGYGVDFYFTAPVDGYYYFLVGCIDDDNGDYDLDFEIELDGSIVATGKIKTYNHDIYGTPPYYNLSWIIPRDAMAVYDYQPNNDSVNIKHKVTLDWATTDDLDFMIFDSYGGVLNYTLSTTNVPEVATFTPTTTDHYTIFVLRYYGAGAVSYTMKTEVLAGAEYEDFYGWNSTWDSVAFYHSTEPRGIGMILLYENETISYTSKDLLWYNDGNDSDIDYIYWARRLEGVSASVGDSYNVLYGVLIWSPNGTTDSERASDFVNAYNGVKNPMSVTLGPIEKYYLTAMVSVIDDDGQPIRGATVKFINTSDLSVVYEAITDGYGVARVEVYRGSYIINVTVSSAGKTYVNDTLAVDYSTFVYTIHSDSRTVKFVGLVRFALKAYTYTVPPELIQNGRIIIRSVADPTNYIDLYTNLSGWIDIYILKGDWIIAFNATTTTPEAWDNITIYTDEALTNNITNAERNVTITISTGVIYYLRDWDITEAPVPTSLVLYDTLSSYEVYWMEIIQIKVNLTRDDTGELINGTVYWFIYNSSGALVIQGTATLISTGTFTFTVDTTLLAAGTSYQIYINATPVSPLSDLKKPLNPAPIAILLNVKERPLSIDVVMDPGTVVYWNSSLSLEVSLTDGLTGYAVDGADVYVTIYASTPITETLLGQGNGYYATTLWSEISVLDAGSYVMIITARKDNYKVVEKTYTLIIKERPTYVDAPSYVETPWVDTYTLEIGYYDYLYNSLIEGAKVNYTLINPVTSEVLLSGSAAYLAGRYVLVLDLTNVPEGAYSVLVFLGKKNYENTTITIAFDVRLRYTSIASDTTRLTIIYGETITIRITYYDEDFAAYIAGANGTYFISTPYELTPITGSLIDLGNGTYILNISSETIGVLGSLVAEIEIGKAHYETKSISVLINVEAIPTEAYSSASSVDIEWGLEVAIDLWYNRTDTDQGISNADNATFKIYYNGSLVLSGNLANLGGGRYQFLVNTTEFVNSSNPYLSTYVLKIFFEKAYHENQTLIIPITVTRVSVISYAQPANISTIWGTYTTAEIHYNRTRDSAIITGAEIMVRVYNASGYTISVPSGAFTVVFNGVYILRINTSLLDTMLYVVEITLSKDFYESASVRVFVNVLPIPTYLAVSQKTVDLEYDESATILVWYSYYENKTLVEDAWGEYVIYYGENVIYRGELLYSTEYASYYFVLDASHLIDLMVGKYNLTFPVVLAVRIEMTKLYHVPQKEFITLSIDQIACYAQLTATEISAEWGETVTVGITIIRNKTGEYVKGFDISISGLPDGSWNLSETDTGYLLTIDTSALEIVQITNKSYLISISFYKEYHVVQSKTVSLTVNRVAISLRPVEEPSEYVEKIQFISEDQRTLIRILVEHNGTAVEDAEIIVTVNNTDAGISRTYTAKKAPPVFEVEINWRDYPPGYTWTVTIKVKSVTIYGKVISEDKLLYSELVYYIKMDYLSGSTKIPGTNIYMANMYLYPLLAIILIGSMVGGYIVISKLLLPPEVKEIDKILKLIEKGIFEYEVPDRKAYIEELIMKELGAK